MKNTIVCLVFCVFVSASCTAQTCTDGNCSISSAKSLALNSGFALFDGNCFTFERSFEIAKISGKFCAEMNQTFVNIQVLGSHVAVLSFADGESLSCTEATQMVFTGKTCISEHEGELWVSMDGTSIGGNALHLSPTAIVDETNDASRTVLAQGIISKILQEFINKKVLSKFHTVPVNQSFDFFDVNMTIREVDMDSLQASNLQVKITAVKLSGVSVGASTVATATNVRVAVTLDHEHHDVDLGSSLALTGQIVGEIACAEKKISLTDLSLTDFKSELTSTDALAKFLIQCLNSPSGKASSLKAINSMAKSNLPAPLDSTLLSKIVCIAAPPNPILAAASFVQPSLSDSTNGITPTQLFIDVLNHLIHDNVQTEVQFWPGCPPSPFNLINCCDKLKYSSGIVSAQVNKIAGLGKLNVTSFAIKDASQNLFTLAIQGKMVVTASADFAGWTNVGSAIALSPVSAKGDLQLTCSGNNLTMASITTFQFNSIFAPMLANTIGGALGVLIDIIPGAQASVEIAAVQLNKEVNDYIGKNVQGALQQFLKKHLPYSLPFPVCN